jgi:hypothetical protein
MTAVSIPPFWDPLFSIVGEDLDRFYVSKPFVLLGFMAILVIRVVTRIFPLPLHPIGD